MRRLALLLVVFGGEAAVARDLETFHVDCRGPVSHVQGTIVTRTVLRKPRTRPGAEVKELARARLWSRDQEYEVDGRFRYHFSTHKGWIASFEAENLRIAHGSRRGIRCRILPASRP